MCQVTTTLPEGGAERACELLGTAVKLADHLLTEKPVAVLGTERLHKSVRCAGISELAPSRPLLILPVAEFGVPVLDNADDGWGVGLDGSGDDEALAVG